MRKLFQLLEFIKTTQLKSFKISGDIGAYDMESYLVDFLCGQTKLEELALRDMDFDGTSISVEKIQEMKFPLKKLSLHQQTSLFQTDENLLAFLYNFVGTLETLDIAGNFPDEAYEMIFKDFSKLKSLVVYINRAPISETFYQSLHANSSIKKLHIKAYRDIYQKAVEGFIGNLPNIESLVLDMENVPQSLIQFVSNNLPKINDLRVRQTKASMLKNVRIGTLKTLTITSMYTHSSKDWKALVKAFHNIETLTIVSCVDSASLNDEMFNIFTKSLPRLSHLKLGRGFTVIKPRVFNQMKNNCKNLKRVEIVEDAFKSKKDVMEKVLANFKRDGLQLVVYPMDKSNRIFDEGSDSLWNKEEVAIAFDDSDSDVSDDDDDSDFLDEDSDDFGGLGNFLGFLHSLEHQFVSDSDNEDDIYFDSDGEMRHWMEEPEDSDFEGFEGDNYHFLD